MNIIILSKNYERYQSGYYHQDLIDAFVSAHDCFLYGPGYPRYDAEDTIEDVMAKSPFDRSSISLIVCSTSWDEDYRVDTVDPHPRIKLGGISDIKIKKVYFLNKEYKKLDLRLEYIRANAFDLVCTVHPNTIEWSRATGGVPFLHLPFGISLERFRDHHLPRVWDFGFSGSLHRSHTDARFLVKKELFNESALDQKTNRGLNAWLRPNALRPVYAKYRIYWAEFGAKNLMLRSALPTGAAYAKFLNQCKTFLSTPSALGIFNTRFFELMATKTLILCPRSDTYMNILRDGENCLMFDPDMSDFKSTFIRAIEEERLRHEIVSRAAFDVHRHSFDARIKTLIDYLISR